MLSARNPVANRPEVGLVGLVVPDFGYGGGASAAGRMVGSCNWLPVVENDHVRCRHDRSVGLRLLGIDSTVDLILDRRIHVEGACVIQMLIGVGPRGDGLSLHRGELRGGAVADLKWDDAAQIVIHRE